MDKEPLKTEKKKTLDDKFNVINVINKTYQDSTEYDLNDSLIFLSNVISKTKVKNKELVKKNFSKFVECRIVLEEILEDMRKKGLDVGMSSEVKENIKNIESKFKAITGEILANSQYDADRDRRAMIIKRYKTLFNLKDLLKANLSHKERFVKIYQEGYNQYLELRRSKHVQNLWASIKEIRIVFLEDIYKEIQSQNNSFIEVLYYFDLYFKVCESKTDRKIMNTLLLNFKEKVLDVPYVEKGYFLKDTNFLYLKTMIHLDKELQRDLTKTLFEKVKNIFNTSSLEFIKIWMKKYKRLISMIDVDLEVSSAYFTILKSMKKDLVNQRMTQDCCLDKLKTEFNFFVEMLEQDEKYILYSRFLQIVREKVKTGVQKMDLFIEKLNEFDKFLKPNEDTFDEFQEMKKELKTREIRKDIVYLAEYTKNNTRASSLMEIVRTINRSPDCFSIIIKGASPAIEKDNVLVYFLHKILEKEEPNLTNEQSEEVRKLEKQFGFLINL
ncbi:Exocyst complex component SEC5A [Nosema granulosis]|uniref:Exocyst complex component SEC5A n=1 Tax=Nosema granulosis TaxID=83296 RepID=A0A9P6KZQ4_9MICR|nr:Exocyst complex component SEC5A [Nosema granulosis]